MQTRFHTNSGARRPRRFMGQASGGTLMELMVTTAVAGMILAAILSSFIFCKRSFVAMGNYMDLDRKSQVALDTLSKDIRQARSLSSFSTNQLVFIDVNSNQLTYTWYSSLRTLVRTSGGVSKGILPQCDYLSFYISQRTPLNNGTWGFYPATNNPAVCKLVDITWRCSRTILGQKVNTESVQTAKIAMRNNP